MKNRVAQGRCNNLTSNKSLIRITQQVDILYKYLKKEVNEAQPALNILSNDAVFFFPPATSFVKLRKRRSTDENEPHNRTRQLQQ